MIKKIELIQNKEELKVEIAKKENESLIFMKIIKKMESKLGKKIKYEYEVEKDTGKVIKIKLRGNQLTELPPEIFQLRNLEWLSLSVF